MFDKFSLSLTVRTSVPSSLRTLGEGANEDTVNRVFQGRRAAFHLRLIYAPWIGVKLSLSPRLLTTFSIQ